MDIKPGVQKLVAGLQTLGRSLMLPIAVLPVAALLLRLGQADLLDIPFMAQAGSAVFANLGMLFAVGVAIGFAKDGGGAAGLAGLVCYLLTVNGAEALVHVPDNMLAGQDDDTAALIANNFREAQIGRLSVPIGIISGIISGRLYSRYCNIVLPEYLAFFGGRRFVPIVSGLAGVLMAFVIGLAWPYLDHGVDVLSRSILNSGEIGLFIFGFLNRLLIVSGLHHILNNVAWFVVGDYDGVTGDLPRFFAGDPSAGIFMTGFFPVMMFGLPAACLAMYHEAPRARRRQVGGLFLSMGLTSFLTGVTEPIEFSFMFLAPVLYLVHAVLTGAAMVIMDVLDVKMGFGFSAGLFDYVLNFGKSTHPLLLLPVGAAYGLAYYGVFRFAIRRFNLKTPGREAEDGTARIGDSPAQSVAGNEGEVFAKALGGAANLQSVSACMTRLRLEIADRGQIDEAQLRALGAKGFVYPSSGTAQIILGPKADNVASAINRYLETAPSSQAVGDDKAKPAPVSSSGPNPEPNPQPAPDPERDAAVAAALGGADNIIAAFARGSRLELKLKDSERLDQAAMMPLGLRGSLMGEDNIIYLLWDGAAPQPAPQEAA